MWKVVREMSLQYCLKSKSYIESARNYLDDYSNIVSKDIDMTMSGRYIGSYPTFDIDVSVFDRYPSHSIVKQLENEIKKKYFLDNEVVIGSGANGILQNLIKIFFVNGGNLVTPFYTFNQAEYAVTSFNGITRRVFMDNENINFDKLIDSIDNDTKMIYICNPNNPTGIYVDSEILLQNISKIDSTIPVVIDESSIEFSLKSSLLEYKLPTNVIVLRTFSKAFGLASLRVGYMCCSKDIYKMYKEKITVNEVSGLSCSIVLQALRSNNYMDNVRKVIFERLYLVENLKKIGIMTFESDSNILLTSTIINKDNLKRLLDCNVSVVLVEDINNDTRIRIAVQDREANKKFIDIMSEIFGNK